MKLAPALKGIAAGLMLSSAVVATLEYLEIRKSERAKRDQMDANTKQTIQAMYIAQDRMIERIRKGDFRGKHIDQVMEAFEFESICAYNEM